MIGRILYWRACQRMRAIAAQDPLPVQRDLLLRLLRRAAGTRFGREHGFAEVRSPEEFRERVPVQDYASMLPFLERARDGAADETWPGVPESFAVTGSSKHFPHTKESLRSALESVAPPK